MSHECRQQQWAVPQASVEHQRPAAKPPRRGTSRPLFTVQHTAAVVVDAVWRCAVKQHVSATPEPPRAPDRMADLLRQRIRARRGNMAGGEASRLSLSLNPPAARRRVPLLAQRYSASSRTAPAAPRPPGGQKPAVTSAFF